MLNKVLVVNVLLLLLLGLTNIAVSVITAEPFLSCLPSNEQ
jgi:hypothetical protein